MPRRKMRKRRQRQRLWEMAPVIHTAQAETLAAYDAWISVSYDPVVGNQQTHKCFWLKVTEVYNARRPKNTVPRNVKMLRSHWDRCDRDVKKFCAIYRGEEANYQSGASGADILRAALRVFKDDVGKDFKLVDVWSQVHHLERCTADFGG
ncbi:glutathione S-transferase T3-like [Salvia hispanica]|uniref:glutathione S-transferase T3-like n=1 Tax=Salvia hispanica TaxID=49212 RepID=UPI0020094825|nr:glutathione S-transferase T3-like [Salvia hispanica]